MLLIKLQIKKILLIIFILKLNLIYKVTSVNPKVEYRIESFNNYQFFQKKCQLKRTDESKPYKVLYKRAKLSQKDILNSFKDRIIFQLKRMRSQSQVLLQLSSFEFFRTFSDQKCQIEVENHLQLNKKELINIIQSKIISRAILSQNLLFKQYKKVIQILAKRQSFKIIKKLSSISNQKKNIIKNLSKKIINFLSQLQIDSEIFSLSLEYIKRKNVKIWKKRQGIQNRQTLYQDYKSMILEQQKWKLLQFYVFQHMKVQGKKILKVFSKIKMHKIIQQSLEQQKTQILNWIQEKFIETANIKQQKNSKYFTACQQNQNINELFLKVGSIYLKAIKKVSVKKELLGQIMYAIYVKQGQMAVLQLQSYFFGSDQSEEQEEYGNQSFDQNLSIPQMFYQNLKMVKNEIRDKIVSNIFSKAYAQIGKLVYTSYNYNLTQNFSYIKGLQRKLQPQLKQQ